MAFIDYFLGRKPNRAENPAYKLTPEIIRGQGVSPIDTTPNRGALRLAAVVAVERFIVESIANLPLVIYRKLPDGGKERATDHPLYTLLKDRPNEYMSPFDLTSTDLKSTIRNGNAYVYLERDSMGQVANLLPLTPGSVKVVFDGTKKYFWSRNGDQYEIPATDILHYKCNSDDGIVGKPLFNDLARVLEIAFRAEEYATDFFVNGHNSPEHIELATWPDEKQMAQLKSSQENWTKNRHSTRLVPGGKLVRTGYSNQESQLIETRKYQLLEIARAARVPPQIIMHYENGGTYANLEAQAIDLVQNSLQPWITPREQEINAKLFAGTEYFAEYLIDARLRGDTQSRYNAYQTALDAGFLTVDEVRARENLPVLAQPQDKLDQQGGAQNE